MGIFTNKSQIIIIIVKGKHLNSFIPLMGVGGLQNIDNFVTLNFDLEVSLKVAAGP